MSDQLELLAEPVAEPEICDHCGEPDPCEPGTICGAAWLFCDTTPVSLMRPIEKK